MYQASFIGSGRGALFLALRNAGQNLGMTAFTYATPPMNQRTSTGAMKTSLTYPFASHCFHSQPLTLGLVFIRGGLHRKHACRIMQRRSGAGQCLF
jgi:hypothetical protein